VDDSSSFRRSRPSEPSWEQRRVICLRQAGSVRAPALVDAPPDRPVRGAELSAGDLFTILWSALAGVLGNAAAAPPGALGELARELCALLVDRTGPVIVNRLAQMPELRSRGVIPIDPDALLIAAVASLSGKRDGPEERAHRAEAGER
jgi:hypothetical protein